MGKVRVPKDAPAPATSEETSEKTTESRKKRRTFKQVLKRYWYWFATIPLLIVVSFVWLYFIGVFDTVNAIVIRSATPKDINLPVNSMYHIVVTSDSGARPVYSSNHTSIVEVTEDGLIITKNEGTAIVTASFGNKKYEVAVTVSSYAATWFLTSGDKFTAADIYDAFPAVRNILQGMEMKLNDYIDAEPGEMGVEYVVKDGIPDQPTAAFFYVMAPEESTSLKYKQKGVLTVWLVSTEEEKQRCTEEYNKTVKVDRPELVIPKDQVDETVRLDCGVFSELRPKVKTEGMVEFFVEGLPDDFPYVLDQTGNINVDAMAEEFFVNVVVNASEVYRIKCCAEPLTSPITLTVGSEMIFTDYLDMIPSDETTQFSDLVFTALSAKMQSIYNDAGEHIGFLATEATEQAFFINCSTKENPDYVNFRFSVEITSEDIHSGEIPEGEGV